MTTTISGDLSGITVVDALTHMKRHYSDWAIANDLDCVLPLLDENRRTTVRRYAKLRRAAPDYRPRDPKANNHKHIDTAELDGLMRPTGLGASRVKTNSCHQCGRSYQRSRSTSRYCAARCRKAAGRLDANVTLKPLEIGSVEDSLASTLYPILATEITGETDTLSVTRSNESEDEA